MILFLKKEEYNTIQYKTKQKIKKERKKESNVKTNVFKR
jgi:hypothetical protein